MNMMLNDLSVVAGRCMEEALRFAYALGFDATVAAGLLAGLVITLGLVSAARPRRLQHPVRLMWQRS